MHSQIYFFELKLKDKTQHQMVAMAIKQSNYEDCSLHFDNVNLPAP